MDSPVPVSVEPSLEVEAGLVAAPESLARGLPEVLRRACSAAVVPIVLEGCAALLPSGVADSFLTEVGGSDSAEDLFRGVPEVLLKACSAAVVPKDAGGWAVPVVWDC